MNCWWTLLNDYTFRLIWTVCTETVHNDMVVTFKSVECCKWALLTVYRKLSVISRMQSGEAVVALKTWRQVLVFLGIRQNALTQLTGLFQWTVSTLQEVHGTTPKKDAKNVCTLLYGCTISQNPWLSQRTQLEREMELFQKHEETLQKSEIIAAKKEMNKKRKRPRKIQVLPRSKQITNLKVGMKLELYWEPTKTWSNAVIRWNWNDGSYVIQCDHDDDPSTPLTYYIQLSMSCLSMNEYSVSTLRVYSHHWLSVRNFCTVLWVSLSNVHLKITVCVWW